MFNQSECIADKLLYYEISFEITSSNHWFLTILISEESSILAINQTMTKTK